MNSSNYYVLYVMVTIEIIETHRVIGLMNTDRTAGVLPI